MAFSSVCTSAAECQQASRCCLPPADRPSALLPSLPCHAAQVPQPLPDNQLGGAARAHPDILRLLRQLLQQRPVWPAAALHEAVAAAGGTARSGTGGRYPADDLLPKLCYKFRNGGCLGRVELLTVVIDSNGRLAAAQALRQAPLQWAGLVCAGARLSKRGKTLHTGGASGGQHSATHLTSHTCRQTQTCRPWNNAWTRRRYCPSSCRH